MTAFLTAADLYYQSIDYMTILDMHDVNYKIFPQTILTITTDTLTELFQSVEDPDRL